MLNSNDFVLLLVILLASIYDLVVENAKNSSLLQITYVDVWEMTIEIGCIAHFLSLSPQVKNKMVVKHGTNS